VATRALEVERACDQSLPVPVSPADEYGRRIAVAQPLVLGDHFAIEQ
jgi:hypothetical protein